MTASLQEQDFLSDLVEDLRVFPRWLTDKKTQQAKDQINAEHRRRMAHVLDLLEQERAKVRVLQRLIQFESCNAVQGFIDSTTGEAIARP